MTIRTVLVQISGGVNRIVRPTETLEESGHSALNRLRECMGGGGGDPGNLAFPDHRLA